MTRSALEVLRIFAKLGVTCFGGPIAHIGYFREEFVVRRSWIDEAGYADLVALCQLLPGPASSQVGFSIGMLRAGIPGGLAAWAGFTLPSAILMVLFAYAADSLHGRIGTGFLHGLTLVAVAIVAQAVWGMARSLCPDRERASIAVLALLVVIAIPSSLGQIAAILLGAAAGGLLCRMDETGPSSRVTLMVSRRIGVAALAVYFGLLIGLPFLREIHWIDMFGAFYHAGALVFGGGHVVLPLLREAVVTPGWVDDDTFLAGYGAAQAMPGPLFTFSAYLGASMKLTPSGVAGVVLSLCAIFLPGILALVGALPFWNQLRDRVGARAAMHGINAAVVGLLGAALYDPVWTSSVKSPADFGIAVVGFVLLMVWRAPPVMVVGFSAIAGIALALMP